MIISVTVLGAKAVAIEQEMIPIEVYQIECENLLDGLQKLHEKLNDVAMPRLKKKKETEGMNPLFPAISC